MIGSVFCSTGAFSRDPDVTDVEDILNGIHNVHCDGFELIFYPSFYEQSDFIGEVLRSVRDNLHVLHTEKSIGPLLGSGNRDDESLALHRLEENAALASTLEIDRLVLHLWGLPDSDRFIDRNLSHFEKCYEIATSYNCELNIESIPCLESTPVEHLTTLAKQHEQALFTLDTEFLAMHGELTSALEDEQLLARTRHLHLKDYGESLVDEHGERVYLHPGQGSIDFHDVLTRIRNAKNVIDVCLESTSVGTSGAVNFEQIQRDMDFIKEVVAKVQGQTE